MQKHDTLLPKSVEKKTDWVQQGQDRLGEKPAIPSNEKV
jgi:hypothetical protein